MLQYWIWLAGKYRLGNKRLLQVLDYFGTPELVFYAQRSDFEQIEGLTRSQIEILSDRNLDPAQKILDKCMGQGIGILTVHDILYSQKLRTIDDAPLVLYYKGSMPAVDTRPSLGVVGTRQATDYGLLNAKRIGYQLAKGGAVVVSGGARGVDSLAMKGALSAGMPVIGVLAGGVDVVYPPENRGLFEDLVHYGCLVSESVPGTPHYRENFPRRNRIISGLSDGVVVVEAPKRSGALITADRAVRQGRDVFALPGSVAAANSAGCHQLIREGAMLIENGWQVLEEYAQRYVLKSVIPAREQVELHPAEMASAGIMGKNQNCPPENDKNNVDKQARRDYIDVHNIISQLNEEQRQIVLALQDGPQTAEALSQRLQMAASTLLSALTILELEGYAARNPDNHFRLAYQTK